jgi:aspartyl-tRNA(Asn)/glutamyl-tRNA(Gln) amidotransferase subunit A
LLDERKPRRALFAGPAEPGQDCERVNEILKDHDFILALSAPSIAPLFTQASDKLSDEYLIADNHLCLGNFAGLPSISLPLGYEKGMPYGVNFMGRAFEEKKLFQMSALMKP